MYPLHARLFLWLSDAPGSDPYGDSRDGLEALRRKRKYLRGDALGPIRLSAF